MGANWQGEVAPHYFVDTVTGPREVHCGFPMQRRSCDTWSGPTVWPGKRIRVYSDDYFGILAFDHLESPGQTIPTAGMSYEQGILYYAQPKHTIYHNRHAHQMLPLILFIYGVFVSLCWRINELNPKNQ